MKHNLTHIVLGMFVLLSGFVAKCSDDWVRQIGHADEAWHILGTYSDDVIKQGEIPVPLSGIAQYGDDEAKSLKQVGQSIDEISPQGQSIESPALGVLEDIGMEAQFRILRSRADEAVAVAINELKKTQRQLVSMNDTELESLLQAFLCFHVETIANSGDLPTDDGYAEFLFDYEITKSIPIWAFKGKAQSIIDFAKSLLEARSGSEVRARFKLLQECALKH